MMIEATIAAQQAVAMTSITRDQWPQLRVGKYSIAAEQTAKGPRPSPYRELRLSQRQAEWRLDIGVEHAKCRGPFRLLHGRRSCNWQTCNDRLSRGDGYDTLEGGEGADELNGGRQHDQLY